MPRRYPESSVAKCSTSRPPSPVAEIAADLLHYDHRRTPPKAGVIQHNQSPDFPGPLRLGS